MTERQTGKGKGERNEPSGAFPVSPFPFPREGRLLGVDWGEKRIGLAISDEAQRIAQPLETLTRRAGRRFPMQQLRRLIETHTPRGVVVGLPLEPTGHEGPAARAARDVGALIGEKTGLPVTYWDERLTTARALAAVRELGGRPRERPGDVDRLSATVLLQAFLDARLTTTGSSR